MAPPPGPGEWDVIFENSEAAKGWVELCAQVPGNVRDAWEIMRRDPAPRDWTGRHHPLLGRLAAAAYRGQLLPQWQIEVTAGGRVWYLVDRKSRRVIVTYASTRHPKLTE